MFTVSTKIENSSHSELIEVANLTGKSIMQCIKDGIDMYIDVTKASLGKSPSADRLVDGMFNETMRRQKAIERLSIVANTPGADLVEVAELVNKLGISASDIDKQNIDKDTKRNNCRYFLKGLLRNGRLEVNHIYSEAKAEGFSDAQIKRSLSDVATPTRVGESEYYWTLKE